MRAIFFVVIFLTSFSPADASVFDSIFDFCQRYLGPKKIVVSQPVANGAFTRQYSHSHTAAEGKAERLRYVQSLVGKPGAASALLEAYAASVHRDDQIYFDTLGDALVLSNEPLAIGSVKKLMLLEDAGLKKPNNAITDTDLAYYSKYLVQRYFFHAQQVDPFFISLLVHRYVEYLKGKKWTAQLKDNLPPLIQYLKNCDERLERHCLKKLFQIEDALVEAFERPAQAEDFSSWTPASKYDILDILWILWDLNPNAKPQVLGMAFANVDEYLGEIIKRRQRERLQMIEGEK